MTGFAVCSGDHSGPGAGPGAGTGAGISWAWELRSVNARGLELRFRLPPGLDRLEATLRTVATASLKRGTVSAALRLSAAESAGVVVDRAILARLAAEADEAAAARPGTPKPRIELLMALPGVVRREAGEAEPALNQELVTEIEQGFAAAVEQLVVSRRAEGARLAAVLGGHLDSVDALQRQAGPEAGKQAAAQRARLFETVQSWLGEWPALSGAPAPSPAAERMTQELALLASRSDVTEEIDRLASHVTAARGLLAAGGPQGRALDFLVQEFMREANTLCSKSASIGLTGIGLQLKSVIEQIREQVQNIE